MARLPFHALDGVSEERMRALLIETEKAQRPKKSKRWLLCRQCGRRIAREQDRIEILGVYEHTRTNPYGITFRFGSFYSAEGCMVNGEPVAAFTWFAGFFWRIALCGGCKTHMGWSFEGPDAGFYGLVLDRLAQTN